MSTTINRATAAVTDDDGTLTTGTVFNNSWYQLLCNAIDAILSGAITIGGAFTTNGQIVFPASQNASAGANTLDDYEEGSWTPALSFGGASVGITYSSQVGTYTKIGNLVVADFRNTLTSKGSSTGAAQLANLPFTVTSIGSSAAVDFAVAGASLTNPYALPNGTAVLLCQTTASVRAQLTDANFTNTSDFRGIVTYRTT